MDPDFLKEDPEFVSEAILQAITDASEQAKKKSDEAMNGLTGGIQMPGYSEYPALDSPYENLVQGLKSLPGLGYRSAEKIALHLLVEKPEKAETLSTLITEAGNLLGHVRPVGI